MKRFMGMMPHTEIKITRTFKDDRGLVIRVYAGDAGWTITYADYSTEFEDVIGTADDNMNAAIAVLKSHLDVTECDDEHNVEL